MQPRHLFMTAIILAVANGIFSPFIAVIVAFAPLWYPAWAPESLPVLLLLSSLVVSTLTLLVAGVPAALYERATACRDSTMASLGILLGATVAICLPALARLFG